jgi:mitochondrial FAD-linked sulfhydryl oxidase
MQRFMAALARFYPCTWCAQDFQQSIKKEPVQTQSRKDLCIWLCEQHNLVNVKTGKPLFLCDMNALDERWRKSDKKQCSGSSLH